MSLTSFHHVSLVLGAAMLGLGLFVAGRLVVRQGIPLTSSLGLDLVFAVFFVVRGSMYASKWLKRRKGPTL